MISGNRLTNLAVGIVTKLIKKQWLAEVLIQRPNPSNH
jgi:hypothetical protein